MAEGAQREPEAEGTGDQEMYAQPAKSHAGSQRTFGPNDNDDSEATPLQQLHKLQKTVDKRVEREQNASTQATEMTVQLMTKAFAIFVAYIMEQFFVRTVGGFIFGHPLDEKMTVVMDLLWCGIVYSVAPFAVWFLAGYIHAGAASRSWFQDFMQLSHTSTMVMLQWAFKDLVHDFFEWAQTWFPAGPPRGEFLNWSDLDAVEARVFHYLIVLGFCTFTTLAGALLNFVAYLRKESMCGCCKSQEKTVCSNFADLWLKTRPLALGIGLAWYEFSLIPYHFYPTLGIRDKKYTTVYNFGLWLLCAVITTKCVTVLMRYNQYRSKLVSVEQLRKSSSLYIYWDFNVTSFMRAQAFVFTWAWAEFFNVCFFVVCFGCPISTMCPSPESSDTMGGPKCGTSTIFMQGYYAVGITGIAILLVPMIRRSSSTISAMGVTIRSMGEGGNHLLIGGGQVKERIKYQIIQDNLSLSFFGIAVGWAWTNVAITECDQDFLPTCPSNQSFGNVLSYFAILVVMVGVTVSLYHSFMENNRLQDRAQKLIAIEEESVMLFKDVDTDNSGTITKDELVSFLTKNGISAELFEFAFDALDRSDGSTDGHCDLVELLHEVSEVLKLLKNGADIEIIHGQPYINGEELGIVLNLKHEDKIDADAIMYVDPKSPPMIELSEIADGTDRHVEVPNPLSSSRTKEGNYKAEIVVI